MQSERSGHESDDTTHFSIIDEAGNILSNTYALNSFYGSQVMARSTGVLKNDIMSGFSNRPAGLNESNQGNALFRPCRPPLCCIRTARTGFDVAKKLRSFGYPTNRKTRSQGRGSRRDD